jgi:hypothetical protein
MKRLIGVMVWVQLLGCPGLGSDGCLDDMQLYDFTF